MLYDGRVAGDVFWRETLEHLHIREEAGRETAGPEEEGGGLARGWEGDVRCFEDEACNGQEFPFVGLWRPREDVSQSFGAAHTVAAQEELDIVDAFLAVAAAVLFAEKSRNVRVEISDVGEDLLRTAGETSLRFVRDTAPPAALVKAVYGDVVGWTGEDRKEIVVGVDMV